MQESITQISFIPLDGATPAELNLGKLPNSKLVFEKTVDAFSIFNTDRPQSSVIHSIDDLKDETTGIHLLYLYGHAWLDDDGIPQVSLNLSQSSQLIKAPDLIRSLFQSVSSERVLIIIDTCHAAAFDPYIKDIAPRLCIYASGKDESAIALGHEEASRFSIKLENEFSKKVKSFDLNVVINDVREALNRDSAIQGQTVSYRSHGAPILLIKHRSVKNTSRERSVKLFRNFLIGGGGLIASMLILSGWFIRNHSFLTLELPNFQSIVKQAELHILSENPETNASKLIKSMPIEGNNIRLWVPTKNIIVRINAQYNDDADRSISYHLLLRPSFIASEKSQNVRLPEAQEIIDHPWMAHIPQTTWLHNREQDKAENLKRYWIDIRPPSVFEYLPFAYTLDSDGAFENNEGSLMLDWMQNNSAIEATGLEQLEQLNNDLADIFRILEADTSNQVAGGGDVIEGASPLPCDDCPAPMLRHEAELFCSSQGKSMPTASQWELAARGVDGRTYPWGDLFDETRANVPGLPDVGEESPSLKPITDYLSEKSPYGLIDTVGNAGDWVVNDSGAYEKVYMGATYQYNQEDATTFRLLPVTDSDFLLREITVRCVSNIAN